jgi:fimbrial chaperone protein
MSMRSRFLSLLTLLPVLLAGQASAAVSVGATRVIYDSAAKEANLSVSNRGEDAPYLVQSWVSAYGTQTENSVEGFLVTPPLFRLDGNSENVLRILYTGSQSLPQDQESLFLMNVKAIPAMSQEQTAQNVLQIALKTSIKLFYRPAGLKGTLKEATANVAWHPSGFNLVVSELKVNDVATADIPDVIRPAEQRQLDVAAEPGDRITLSYIDEYGSTLVAPIAQVN